MAAALVLMNTYPLWVSEDLVFRAKATSLQNCPSWSTPCPAWTG